jgi:threonyl-tRNA synthetase
LEQAVKNAKLDCEVDPGGGAFYGPKIDLKIKDAIGREWQTSTIQFDFNLPERFDLYFIGEDGKKHRPYMVHRALLGSLERFFGILIEHYAGALPVWLAPVQARILPITERHHAYGLELQETLRVKNLRIHCDLASESLGAKIRKARNERIPYLLVVGDREVENHEIAVRKRGINDAVSMGVNAFIDQIQDEIAARY